MGDDQHERGDEEEKLLDGCGLHGADELVDAWERAPFLL